MIRTTLTAAALAIGSLLTPALADSTKAWCALTWYDTSEGFQTPGKTIKGPCTLSQSQDNSYVDDFICYKFVFPASKEGKTYTVGRAADWITFDRKDQYNLNVLWKNPVPGQPSDPCPHSLAAPSMADSTKAYCTLVWDDTSKVPIRGPCDFSQSSGNVYVYDFNYYNFAFPPAEQGKTYQRDNREEGISFSRKGQYKLNVY
jgi:hypothetical protein